MQYYTCKCGKMQFFGSGMLPYPCSKCSDCGTNCYKEEPQPHDFSFKEKVETDEGTKSLTRCNYCFKTKRQIELLNGQDQTD